MHVELREIRKYFGKVKANDGIDLILKGGNIYGLLGENGAGKSTLMKILSGYQSPDSGKILINGDEKNFQSPRKALVAGVGMLYQDPLDLPPFRIIDNYLLGYNSRFVLDYGNARKELSELISRYNFKLDLNASVDTFSLGERQQMELVRLLAGGAQLLILDEPTTGISAEQKDQLFGSIRQLAKNENKILILVSHKLDEIQELCDHVFVLRQGKLIGETSLPCTNEKLVEMMFGKLPSRSERKQLKLGSTMFVLKNFSVNTYRLKLNKINFSINTGEIFGLAGLEGSGQKILMQACAGLLPSVSGQKFLKGQDVTNWSYHKMQAADIAYVAAGRLEEGLVAGLTLTEHVVLAKPDNTFFVDWDGVRKETEDRIRKYQIVGKHDTTADELSGGNMQRLLFGLLRTSLNLLLLEHPTRGLDVRSTDYIWELLYNRCEHGTAIMFMSADLDEIIERSDRIAVFSGGVMSRIVEAKDTDVDELGHLIGGQI